MQPLSPSQENHFFCWLLMTPRNMWPKHLFMIYVSIIYSWPMCLEKGKQRNVQRRSAKLTSTQKVSTPLLLLLPPCRELIPHWSCIQWQVEFTSNQIQTNTKTTQWTEWSCHCCSEPELLSPATWPASISQLPLPFMCLKPEPFSQTQL